MKVKELKEILQNVDDDTELLINVVDESSDYSDVFEVSKVNIENDGVHFLFEFSGDNVIIPVKPYQLF